MSERFAPVRIDPMRLAESMPLRRAARALKRSHRDLIAGLACVWSWQAAAWTPTSPWGDAVPIALVDELVGHARASDVLVREALATVVRVEGVMCLRLLPIEGGPDVRTRYSWSVRGRKGGAAFAEGLRRRARAGET